MAESEVIREFLVSLGFQTDEAGLRKFQASIVDASKQVAEFALAIEAAAVAVVAGVTKMAEGLDQLYFASQRTAAAAVNIQAIGYAASQTGSSVAGATGSLEALAAFLRNNPQGETFLHGLGVTSHDTAIQLQQLGAAFRSVPLYEQHNYAQMLGIDDKTALALRSGDFDRFAEEHRRRVQEAGLDQQKAAKDSNAYMTALRSLGDTFGVLADKVGASLTGRAGGYIHQFQQFIEHNFAAISTAITRVANVMLTAAEVVSNLVLSVSAGINEVTDVFMSLSRHSQGLIETFGLIAGAWLALNTEFATSPLGIILELGAGILLLWDDYQTWKKGGSSLIDWAKWEPDIQKAKDAMTWLGQKFHDLGLDTLNWQVVLTDFAEFLAAVWAVRVIATLTSVGAAMVGFGKATAAGAGSGVQGFLMRALVTAGLADAALTIVDPNDKAGTWIDSNVPGAGAIDDWFARTFGLGRTFSQQSAAAGVIPANANKDTPDKAAAAEDVFSFWKGKGYSDAGAASMVAGARRESDFNPGARGDKDANGNFTAAGLYQWHPDRRKAILDATGIDVATADLHQQLEAAYQEQKQHLDAGAGRAFDAVRNAASTIVGTHSEVNDFERSADRTLDQAKDQSYADSFIRLHQFRASPLFQPASPAAAPAPGSPGGSSNSVNANTTINVHGSSDPQATAAEVAKQQDSVNQRTVRHLSAAAN